MVDLTTVFEDVPSTIKSIDDQYEAFNEPRTHLGLSQAGHPCKRRLWYQHHGYIGEQPEGRVLRLFRLGDMIEDAVIADLILAGIKHWGSQDEVVFTQEGVRLVGHIDGKVLGLIEAPKTIHLFECKSANKKKFEELLKKGSYAEWNEVYGWQVQFYMLGLKLRRAVVFVYCKDDSRLYMERIKLDREATIKKLRSVFEAITSPVEPDRKCPREDFYQAKFCPFQADCFGKKKEPAKLEMPWT